GWRSIFIFAIPWGILVLMFIFKLTGEWLEKDVGGFNVTIISIFALSLIALMYGLSVITTFFGILLTIIGLIGCFTFIWLQKKVPNPLIHPRLLFNRIYIINNLTSLVNYGPGIFSIFLLSLYLQNLRGLSPDQAGLLLCVQSVFIAIASVLVGRLRDYTRPRYIAAMGMALTAVGLTFFIFLDMNTTFQFIIIGLAIIGFGYGLSAASSTEISLKYVEKRFYGISSASLNTMRVVGQMIGMGITMAVLALFMGTSILTPENSIAFIESCRIPFLIYAILCYISIYGYFIIRKKE
ncbi:MAG: MFS transporter, partial [Methanobacterium sp.]|nr:MFS transporter [Methanobacterium sp.]